MAITFSCECGKRMQAKDEFAGRRTKCAACGSVLVIPDTTYDLDQPERSAAVMGANRLNVAVDQIVPQAASGGTPPHIPAIPINPPEPELPPGWPSSLPPPSVLREPTCYGFLEKYASGVRWLGIIASAMLLTPIFFFYVTQSYEILGLRRHGNTWMPLILAMIITTFYFLAGILAVLLVVLVPILFAVSLIQVVVDAGRNLRAIRSEIEARR